MAKKEFVPIIPEMMKQPWWRAFRPFIRQAGKADKSRGQLYVGRDDAGNECPEKLINLVYSTLLHCGDSTCPNMVRAIRSYDMKGKKRWNVVQTCAIGKENTGCYRKGEVRAKVTAILLDIKKAESSPRMKKAVEDTMQGRFEVDGEILG